MSRLARASLALAVVAVAACQGPPPVGRAADPTPVAMPGFGADSESAGLLKQVDALQKQLKDQPKSLELKLALGKLYYENERFLDAAVMLRQAIDEAPENTDARKLLGNCLFFLGNPDGAVAMHEAVLRQEPNDLDAMFFLGAILVESRPQDADALKRTDALWSRFIELAPNHPRRTEIEQQLESVRKAARGEITLGNQPPQQRRAPAQQDDLPVGDQQGAMGGQASFQGRDEPPPAAAPPIKKGTRVPALAADAPPLERKRAEALDALDEARYADARAAAEAALQLAPTDSELGVVRARTLTMSGEIDVAIRQFGEVIKRNPRYSPAWHYLGMAHMLNSDPKRAAQTWRDLAQMDPAYAAQYRLQQRAEMAERMAQ